MAQIHALRDSKELVKGYRAFENIWTLVAAVQPAFVLGLTATLRPRFEPLVAHMCGLTNFGHTIRASCRRPAVKFSLEVHENEEAALFALVRFKPQLLCVKTKADIDRLKANALIKRTYRDVFAHHRDLSQAEKDQAFAYLHTDCGNVLVIATSGITTGKPPCSLCLLISAI